jgi:hypothetical protein
MPHAEIEQSAAAFIKRRSLIRKRTSKMPMVLKAPDSRKGRPSYNTILGFFFIQVDTKINISKVNLHNKEHRHA